MISTVSEVKGWSQSQLLLLLINTNTKSANFTCHSFFLKPKVLHCLLNSYLLQQTKLTHGFCTQIPHFAFVLASSCATTLRYLSFLYIYSPFFILKILVLYLKGVFLLHADGFNGAEKTISCVTSLKDINSRKVLYTSLFI